MHRDLRMGRPGDPSAHGDTDAPLLSIGDPSVACRRVGVCALALRAAELDEVPIPPDELETAVSRRADRLLADLVEPARSRALERLGDGASALSIATRWLRRKRDDEPFPRP
jgi:hypothetical protein